MNLVFRVDASNVIGTGHVMRCLTLANAAMTAGHASRFISRNMLAPLANLITSAGHDLHMLTSDENIGRDGGRSTAHDHWLGVAQSIDARETIGQIHGSGFKPDWVIVDHYGIARDWEKQLQEVCGRMLVIDDLADRQHECDGILDQNFYQDMSHRYDGLIPYHATQLLGPDFALLRPEFAIARAACMKREGPVRRLLVFLGGADQHNVTGVALDALSAIDPALRPADVDVVAGGQHPALAELAGTCRLNGWTLHVQTSDIASLMAGADAAYGAGGSATWERCAVGLPTLTAVLADNQRQLTLDGHQRGFLFAPAFDPHDSRQVKMQLERFLRDTGLRQAISECAMGMVDGAGAGRVLTFLEGAAA